MSNDPASNVQPKDAPTIRRETVSGLVVAVLGVLLVVYGHEPFGSLALWVGTGCVGLGFYAVNKKLMTGWMVELREFLRFWRRGPQ